MRKFYIRAILVIIVPLVMPFLFLAELCREIVGAIRMAWLGAKMEWGSVKQIWHRGTDEYPFVP